MPKPFDASTKFLVDVRPEDWIAFLGLPPGVTRLVDTDVSTITAAGDSIVQVKTTTKTYGVHFEFQAGADHTFEERLWQYNVLYTVRQRHLVRSVAVLLRPFDGHRTLSGRLIYKDEDDETGDFVHCFRYRVFRVWEMSPEAFLNGGLALLPLATVSRATKREVPGIVKRIEERLQQEAKPSESERLRTATSVLMGLKYDKAFVEKIMSKNVLELSSVYKAARQEGLEEGRAEGLEEGRREGRREGRQEGRQEGRREGAAFGARETLLRAGRRQLGEPSAEMVAYLESITDAETLVGFVERLWDIETWDELRPRN